MQTHLGKIPVKLKQNIKAHVKIHFPSHFYRTVCSDKVGSMMQSDGGVILHQYLGVMTPFQRLYKPCAVYATISFVSSYFGFYVV
jgi:hypothetical protein